MAFITRSAKIFRRLLITSKVTVTGQSHFILIFWTPQGHFMKSHQLRKVTLVDLDGMAPVLQVISQGCVLTYGI